MIWWFFGKAGIRHICFMGLIKSQYFNQSIPLNWDFGINSEVVRSILLTISIKQNIDLGLSNVKGQLLGQ